MTMTEDCFSLGDSPRPSSSPATEQQAAEIISLLRQLLSAVRFNSPYAPPTGPRS